MEKIAKIIALSGLGALLLGGVAFANVGNDHTGADSENKASVEQSSHASVRNDNDADIFNNIKGWADSGKNKANENTGDGSATSGNASGTIRLTNTANNNMVELAAPAMGTVSVVNSTTGADSENDAWVKMHNDVNIDNDNDADVHNCLTVSANSGGNRASENTGDGSIHAGNASLDLTITNTLNANNVSVK